ncbi:M23 family metallopeptidase [Candidatus Uhrbacteria bacterium]|nr:M23 family metallopeptidase [Candidatus Uhrbacteria bacterium]
MKLKTIVILLAVVVIVGGSMLAVKFSFLEPEQDPLPMVIESPSAEINTDEQVVDDLATEPRAYTAGKQIHFSQNDALFRFDGTIPDGWKVEYVPEIQALNIYDPEAADTDREASQIFIRQFTASTFLTLSTVAIHSREETQLHGKDAVRYEIEKKPGIPSFPHQPQWRSERHRLIDVRYSKQSPSVFYVIAFNPLLEKRIEEEFLASLSFHNDPSSFVAPIDRASERITKKPFGIRVSSDDSPVQPERFAGYHTGVDFETFSEEADSEVEARSICGGIVRSVRSAQGYGGVVVQECALYDGPIYVVYGHLKPADITAKTGDYLSADTRIGVLGSSGTQETGGERKHLHLGIVRGGKADISGYVKSQKELSAWIDPCSLDHVCE